MKTRILLLLLLLTASSFADTYNGGGVKSWRLSVDGINDSSKIVRSVNSQEGLLYLNTLRSGAGQTTLLENEILNTSALNHSNYLITNNISGHYETAGTTGFTGVQPWERSSYAGYLSSISENVSTGQDTIKESIDGLYSAIYHRLGFQDFSIDEIGIGVNFSSTGAYTYNMGNKKLNDACSGTSFNGFGSIYTGICSDTTFKMEESVYQNAKNANKAANPSKVLWPYSNQKDVPPVFFEESPDPLPDYSVSGYPISLKFNDYFHTTVTLESFKLYDSKNGEITNTRLLNNSTDPNSKITTHEFALFPLSRLDWNSKYTAKAQYSVDGVSETLEWSFTTKSTGYDYYTITNSSTDITIQSNKTYALYFPPSSPTDVLTSYRSRGVFLPEATFIDSNTLSVSTTDNIGATTTITLSNGKIINITIASTDTATVNTTQEILCAQVITPALNADQTECIEYSTPCSVPSGWTTTNSCNSSTLNYSAGWNLLALPTDLELQDTSKFGSFNSIWKYSTDNTWLNPTTIKAQEGFWLQSTNGGALKRYGSSYSTDMTNLTTGWHLLGAGSTINSTNLTEFQAVWIYKDNSWISSPIAINSGEGFWVLK